MDPCRQEGPPTIPDSQTPKQQLELHVYGPSTNQNVTQTAQKARKPRRAEASLDRGYAAAVTAARDAAG